MAGRTNHYGGIVTDGLVFHIDAAKQESYGKIGMRYSQNGNVSLFKDFADTSINPSSQNATGSIAIVHPILQVGATFSNFAPYHLSDYTTPYYYNSIPVVSNEIPTSYRSPSPIWTTLEHSWDANGDVNDSKGSAHGSVVTPAGQTFSPSTMTYESGRLGSAFTFNGSNFISLPEYSLTFTGDFSVGLWFFAPAVGTTHSLISSFHNTGDYTEYNGWSIVYNAVTRSLTFTIYIKMGAPGNPGSQYYGIPLTTSTTFALGQWSHVLVTRKANTRSRIYVNGVLSGSDTNIYNPSYHSTPNLAYIGASYYAFSAPFYNAVAAPGLKIDMVQTFTSELDIVWGYQAPLNYFAMTGLYWTWKFDNNAVGTSYGNIEFSGPNDYIKFEKTPEITGLTDFTVSTWFYINKFIQGTPTIIGTTSVVVARYGNSNGFEIGYTRIGSTNTGVVFFGGREDSSLYIHATSSLLVKSSVNGPGLTANGGWYNVVGTKTGNTWRLYVAETNRYMKYNDRTVYEYPYKQTLVGSASLGTGTTPLISNALRIGSSDTFRMDGRVMNVSIYNRALSLDEINQNYDVFTKRIIRPFDRELNKNVLITYNVLDSNITSALNGIQTREQSLGKIVTVIAGYSNLPADLSMYAHIWDIDYVSDQLVLQNSTKYATYLQGGGALFLIGENNDSAYFNRRNTLANFITSMGGGSVTIDTNYTTNNPSNTFEIVSPFLQAGTSSSIKFPATGRYSTIGTGVDIVRSTEVFVRNAITYPIGTGGVAVLWRTGSLSNAPRGAIVSIMDVNIWASIYTTAPFYGEDFTKNISLIMDRF